MISKFSVKKPFTVLVAIVLVLVLGVVAFTKMTPDLLPNMDLPYVMVITSYAGASPEEVETTVTKPVESAMATLDNIESVSSQSSENISMVILQFSDDADMDATTMNIREKLGTLSGAWNDYIGTPYILKLNPNMIPVSVAAVSMEGMSDQELSTFLSKNVLSLLDGIDGVASVSASGMIEETVNVLLSQEKLDALNQTIQKALETQFSDGETTLRDALASIEEGITKANSSKDTLTESLSALNAQQAALTSSLEEARNALDTKKVELLGTKLSLLTQLESLKKQLSSLQETKSQLLSLQENVTTLEATDRLLVEAAMAADESLTEETARAYLAANSVPYAKTQEALKQIDTALLAMDLTRSELPAKLTELDGGIGTLEETVSSLEGTVADLESGAISVDDGLVALRLKEADAQLQLNTGLAQIVSAESTLPVTLQLLSSQKQELEGTLSELLAKKEQALSGADLKEKLTLSSVSSILSAQNFSMPAGYVQENGVNWLVRVGDRFSSVQEIEDLVLFDLGIDGISPITLTDVADVFVTDNSATTYAKINGENGILLSFSKQSGYATAVVSETITKELAAIENQFEGLHFTSLMDQGEYIHLVVDSVLQNLLLGALFAILILFLFLRDIKPTLIVACSVPVSVTFAIVLMYFSGVTLNVISLSGLAVGVGMLVDNSIVVIENVYRLRRNGLSAVSAAVSGAAQVAGAITSSTLTTICVFFPIVFIQGITRQLFTDMALTIAYSLLASLLIALTLIPAMSSAAFGKISQKPQKVLNRITDAYRSSLSFVLRHKAPALLLALVLLGASVFLALSRGFSYMPEMDSEQVMLTVQMPEGSSFDDTVAMSETITSRVSEIPDVETVGAMMSGGMGSIIGLNMGKETTDSVTMYIILKEDKTLSNKEAREKITALCADLDCEVSASAGTGMSSYSSVLGGSGISVDIYSDDLDTLKKTAEEVAALLSNVEGVSEVSDGIGETTPELRITVDKEKAALKGLTVAQVFSDLSTALTASTTATTLTGDEDSRSVVVRSSAAGSLSPDDIRNYVLKTRNTAGESISVPLSELAEITETETLSSISRSEQRRTLTVTATLKSGYNVTLVTDSAKKALEAYTPATGSRYEFSGENENIMSALSDLVQMLLLGVAIVYLIMVAQFQSLLSPLIVMFTIPLAFTGGFFALLLSGFEVSVVSMIGFVMLVGIIVNNGIVIVDCINRFRQEGKEKKEAILDACTTRLRPVLMTAITTVLGLIPLAVGIGMGADLIQPVAIVCIGGLLYATLMTLYIIPAIYDAFHKRALRKIRDEDLEISKL